METVPDLALEQHIVLISGAQIGESENQVPRTICSQDAHGCILRSLGHPRRLPSLFVVEPENRDGLVTALDALSKTITNTSDRIALGAYGPENSFLFSMQDQSNEDLVANDAHVRRHARVATLRATKSLLATRQFDHATQGLGRERALKGLSLERLFPGISGRSRTFTCGTVPYPPNTAAEKIEDPISNDRLFTNHTGFEVLMIEVQSCYKVD